MTRAAVCPAYGPPEVVRIEEQASQPLEDGQVRVRVGAAAVNCPDVLLVANQYQISVPTPFVVGSEFAGIIVEVAGGTDNLAIGDRVTGTGMFGAFAEEVVVRGTGAGPDSGRYRRPYGGGVRGGPSDGVPHAAVGRANTSGRRRGRARRRRRRRAGSRSAGYCAVGADVTAVASSAEKLDAAASYGAKHLVDHRSGDLRAALRDAVPEGRTPS